MQPRDSGGAVRAPRPSLALGLTALSALLFSTMNFLARVATTSASWATIAATRALMGALVAYTVARMRGGTVAAKDYRAVFWRSFFGTISMLSTFFALSSKNLSLGDVVTLLNVSPVFLALLAPFVLKERTSKLVGVAIGIALTGVVFVVRPSFVFGHAAELLHASSGPSARVTVMVAIGAALSTSFAMMMLRRVGQTESAEAIAFHFSVFAAVILSLISLFDLRIPSPRDAVFMLLAGICAGFGQLAMTRAYSLESTARVGGMSYLVVPISALLGTVFLDERLGPTTAVGMVLVVAGGILVSTRPRVPSRS
jgi:drug/metabolite transporter (DMT)-like permease